MQRYIGQLIQARITRRDLLHTALLGAALPGVLRSAAAATTSGLNFTAIPGSQADRILLADGYTHDVLIRWGDSLSMRVPSLDTRSITQGALSSALAASQQALQFGSHCDAIHYFPLPGARAAQRGVLCVNNEYTSDYHLFPAREVEFGTAPDRARRFYQQHPHAVAFAKAAHGISIVEIERLPSGPWRYVRASKFNRRITADTAIELRGPARGHALMRTGADPTGTRVLGTFANCAGGRTPWGTYLSAEENIQDYFGNAALLARAPNVPDNLRRIHQRWRLWPSTAPYGWDVIDRRFDLPSEPTEPCRHGWIVEVDPLHPERAPSKRTALGRFAHEAASPIVAANGRVAVYMGDDDRFEYVYKFVSNARYIPNQPDANQTLLDDGVLYVARFDAGGRGEWLPLVYDSRGPLNERSGFASQADVLINARGAADVLGATMMDRPEDVEPNPITGKVYVVCTRNELRTASAITAQYGNRQIDVSVNAANPRSRNLFGHIIEISEDNADHTARGFRWEVMLMGGDSSDDARSGPPAKTLSTFGSPDNIGFDNQGHLWIVTDGDQPNGNNNGCFACATTGPERGMVKQFLSAPVGAELCGCSFTPDGETLFLSVQHPGEGSSLQKLSSHWPDGGDQVPRSAVIAIRKERGGAIGS